MSNGLESIETMFKQQLLQLDAFYANNHRNILAMRTSNRNKNIFISRLNTMYNRQKTIIITTKNNKLREYLEQQQQQEQQQEQWRQQQQQKWQQQLQEQQQEQWRQQQAILNNTELKSLLIGINYTRTPTQLYGCINDAHNLQSYLTTKYNFNTNNVCVLTDNTIVKPTRQSILKKYKDLLMNAKSGDKLFFTYSGHGSYRTDVNKDEKDGKDELLITIDQQAISDDELKFILNEHLPEGVTLFILFDCCHSGTLMDLKYNYLSGNDPLNDQVEINESTSETKSNVFLISGCFDSQTSADTFIDNKYQGALTWSFLKVMTEHTNLTWKSLLINMRDLLKPNYSQIPQLSSGKMIDINSPLPF
jgi:hypothetical protein